MMLNLSPKSYTEMLSTLRFTTSVFTVVVLYILQKNELLEGYRIPEKLSQLAKMVHPFFGSLSDDYGYLIIVFIFVYIFNALFEPHNRIAKLIGVRRHWELKYIVTPMYQHVTSEKVEVSPQTFKKIMTIYYENVPRIDSHYRDMFWQANLWFWMFFEFSIVLAMLLPIVFVRDCNSGIVVLFALGFFITIKYFYLNHSLSKKSTDQVNKVLEIEDVVEKVRVAIIG